MLAVAVELSALVIIALAYGLLAELLGMHWVLGAFMAGLFFEPARVGKGVHLEIRLVTTAITAGFLGPLFFASIGVKVDLSVVTGVPLFLLLLIVLAVSSKMLGAGLPALWSGLGRHEALAVGIGMSARGAVELVIIRIAWDAGLFAGVPKNPVAEHLFSALILMAVITTLITPIALRRLLKTHPSVGRKERDSHDVD